MPQNRDAPRDIFGIHFSLLARRWRRVLDSQLAKVGMTDATWVPLVHLKRTGGGIVQKELAELVGVDASSLVRILDILSREGLIERRRSETDGRARLIYLTPSGEQRVTEIHRQLTKAETVMLADLSDTDLSVMLDNFAIVERRLARLEQGDEDAFTK